MVTTLTSGSSRKFTITSRRKPYTSHLFGAVRTAIPFSGSTGLPMVSRRHAPGWSLDISGEQNDDRGVPPPVPGEGADAADALHCCRPSAAAASLSRRCRHAGSRKMPQARMHSAEAPCGRDRPIARMILFWRAVARHLMMWSTSKPPARHSRTCALSSDCASLERRGGENGVVPVGTRSDPLAASAAALMRASTAPCEGRTGAECGAFRDCTSATTSAALWRSVVLMARTWPSASWGSAVASGRLILSASPQSSCESW
mmetsp:Transcript_79487/g.207325  ORF Transcript_79487/g.207325 Transcript_79487/m.207325 type:complete len:259 (+) Transcript_79487:495-1271(+)